MILISDELKRWSQQFRDGNSLTTLDESIKSSKCANTKTVQRSLRDGIAPRVRKTKGKSYFACCEHSRSHQRFLYKQKIGTVGHKGTQPAVETFTKNQKQKLMARSENKKLLLQIHLSVGVQVVYFCEGIVELINSRFLFLAHQSRLACDCEWKHWILIQYQSSPLRYTRQSFEKKTLNLCRLWKRFSAAFLVTVDLNFDS